MDSGYRTDGSDEGVGVTLQADQGVLAEVYKVVCVPILFVPACFMSVCRLNLLRRFLCSSITLRPITLTMQTSLAGTQYGACVARPSLLAGAQFDSAGRQKQKPST